jgi:hypothetical protein
MKDMTLDEFVELEDEMFGYGYGTGEKYTLATLKDIMANLEQNKRSYNCAVLEDKLGGRVAWLMINALIKADVFDYGISTRTGWLTGKGEALRNFLEKYTEDELYEILLAV